MITQSKNARLLAIRCMSAGLVLFMVILILPLFSLRFDPLFNFDISFFGTAHQSDPSKGILCLGYQCSTMEQLRTAFGNNVIDDNITIVICWFAEFISFLLISSGTWLLFAPKGNGPWLLHPLWLTLMSLGYFLIMIIVYLSFPAFISSLLNTPSFRLQEAGNAYLDSQPKIYPYL